MTLVNMYTFCRDKAGFKIKFDSVYFLRDVFTHAVTFINVKIKNCWTEITGNITFAYSHGENKKNFPSLVWKEKGKCESGGRRNENGNRD